jgi:hypothetical protein
MREYPEAGGIPDFFPIFRLSPEKLVDFPAVMLLLIAIR